MKTIFITLAALFTLLSACRKQSINCDIECDANQELIFQTGFDGTTIGDENAHDKAQFSGNDTHLDSISDWKIFGIHPNIGQAEINYEEGDASQRLASIVEDPDSAGNSVMKFQIWEPHIEEGSTKKGRVNTLVRGNNCLKEIYQKVKLYLHPDLEHLTDWDQKITWLTLFEFWNNSGLHKEKRQFRITVALNKEEGSGNPLQFNVKGDRLKTSKWEATWQEPNASFEIPFGSWFEVELYVLEGDQNNGRFYMAVKPEGEAKQILFDVTNYTHHPKEKCPDGFTDFNPHKLYTSQELIEYMTLSNKNLAIYWDDWELYKHRQP